MQQKIVQQSDGYLNKTPLFQFILLSCLFPLWGCAARGTTAEIGRAHV